MSSPNFDQQRKEGTMQLKDKVAFVTGSAAGIGKEIAIVLA